MNSHEIKEHVKKFEKMLFTIRQFLESARRERLPAWDLNKEEIEILVAGFERELLGLSVSQRELEARQPEFEALQAVGMEFYERAKKFEIHNQAEYEEAQRLRAEITAHEQVIKAKFAPLIEVAEQRYYRLVEMEERLLASPVSLGHGRECLTYAMRISNPSA